MISYFSDSMRTWSEQLLIDVSVVSGSSFPFGSLLFSEDFDGYGHRTRRSLRGCRTRTTVSPVLPQGVIYEPARCTWTYQAMLGNNRRGQRPAGPPNRVRHALVFTAEMKKKGAHLICSLALRQNPVHKNSESRNTSQKLPLYS